MTAGREGDTAARRGRRLLPLLLIALGLMVGLMAPGAASAAPSATPPVTSGLQLWYEADTTPYPDGAAVTSWADKSGFGRTLSAFDAGAAPVMRRGAVNGRAAVEFDGVRSLLKTYSSTFTLSQPTTFFVVYRSLDPNTGARAFVFDSRNSSVRQVFGRPGAGQVRLYANLDFDFAGISYPFPSFDIWSGTFNGGASSLYRNGTVLGTGNAGGSALDGFAVGALSTSAQYGYDYAKVQVAEILYYSGSLSTASRTAVTDWLNERYATVAPPTPPTNSAAPSVSGTPTDGAQLTAARGTWSGTQPISYAYQWQRCADGGDCQDIQQATQATYTATASDVGSRLAVKVTASNTGGSASATSARTAIITAGAPVNVASPTISGTARVGEQLTAGPGSWTGTAPITYAYDWQRCDAQGLACQSTGATTQTYTLGAADVGDRIRVTVSASNSTATTVETSDATAPVLTASSGTPPVTSGLQLWYEADASSAADGAPVLSWSDQSGYGRTLSAFDAGAAPVMRRNAVNGRAALEFDGSNALMKTYGSTFTLPQPTTFFVVYRSLDANTSARAFVFDSRDSANRQVFGRASQGGLRLYANNDLDFPGFTYPFGGFEIWNGIFDGGASALWRNGQSLGTGNAGGAAQSGFAVGGLSTAGQYGYDRTHSLISEILYYTGRLSASDRDSVTAWLNGKYQTIAAPTPPSNATPPSLSGQAKDGAQLSLSTGTWNGSTPLAYSYAWSRCDSAGANCAPIPGASAATYALTSNDLGFRIRGTVTATNGAGTASADTAPTAAVAPSAPVNTAVPTVTGNAAVDATLSTTGGTWTGTAPITRSAVWQRCSPIGSTCTDIPGATGLTYVPVSDDVGYQLRVVVTATNGVGQDVANSVRTSAVVASGSSGPGLQPPTTSSGALQLWYEANTEAYADAAKVTRWTDKSGNGRDLTAFDSGAAPTMRRSALNGRAAIEFDGASSLMKTYESTFTLPQPTTFFIVYKSLDVASPGFEAYVFDSRDSGVRQLFGLGPFTNTEMYADIDVEAPTPYPFPGYQVWSGTLNGSNSPVYRNGSLVASGPAGNASLSGFSVGALSTSGPYGYHYGHSVVAEILYYTGSMSASDRDAVTTWLNQKYGVY